MSYRTVAAIAAVLLVGVWLTTEAFAQRGGGRGGGGRGGAGVGVGGGRPNVGVDRTVVRPGVRVGVGVAAGAAAAGAYYAECGYFPYPPCQ